MNRKTVDQLTAAWVKKTSQSGAAHRGKVVVSQLNAFRSRARRGKLLPRDIKALGG